MKTQLTKTEENNAKYSNNPNVNRTSLHLTGAAKARRAGNVQESAKAFLAAVGTTPYPDAEKSDIGETCRV